MIYQITGFGLKTIEAPGKDKNNLPIGTILQLHGYNYDKYVIVKNFGINSKFAGYGSSYQTVNIDNLQLSRHQAYLLKYEGDGTMGIHVAITDHVLPAGEVLEIYEKALSLQKSEKEKRAIEEQRISALIEKGKTIFNDLGLKDYPALIVARHETDDCNFVEDYFNTKTSETIILAASPHKRSLFPEMRKAAAKFGPTKHLSVKPDVNKNGEKRTEINKSWWTAKDEHRETYSMGKGTYLKASGCYSTGWMVEKELKYSGWGNWVYLCLATQDHNILKQNN